MSRKDAYSIKILLPSLKEQKAIAGVLGGLDDKIDLLRRQNKTLEEMTQAIYREMFVENKKDDWEEAQLGDLFDIKIGRTPPRKEFHWFSKNPERLAVGVY